MTTLTATARPDGASVELTLTPSAQVEGILRSDANGNTQIRVPAGTFPRTTPLTITDWEASLQGSVTYSVAGAAPAVLDLPATQPWLVFPLRPAYSLPLDLVTEYSAGRVTLGTIHQVPDRPDPLANLGRLAMRTGQLAIHCDTYTEARLLETQLDLSGMAQLKQPDLAGMDMYFIPAATAIDPDEEDTWRLSVDFTETTRPLSPVQANAWTFGTVATSYSSFANVSASYDDFEMLAINDQTGVI